MENCYCQGSASVRGRRRYQEAESCRVWRSDRSCGFNKETESNYSNLAKGVTSTTKGVTHFSLLDFTWCLTKMRGQGACPCWSAFQKVDPQMHMENISDKPKQILDGLKDGRECEKIGQWFRNPFMALHHSRFHQQFEDRVDTCNKFKEVTKLGNIGNIR